MKYENAQTHVRKAAHAAKESKNDKRNASWHMDWNSNNCMEGIRYICHTSKNIGEAMTWAECFYLLGKEITPVIAFATPLVLVGFFFYMMKE